MIWIRWTSVKVHRRWKPMSLLYIHNFPLPHFRTDFHCRPQLYLKLILAFLNVLRVFRRSLSWPKTSNGLFDTVAGLVISHFMLTMVCEYRGYFIISKVHLNQPMIGFVTNWLANQNSWGCLRDGKTFGCQSLGLELESMLRPCRHFGASCDYECSGSQDTFVKVRLQFDRLRGRIQSEAIQSFNSLAVCSLALYKEPTHGQGRRRNRSFGIPI